MTKYYPQGLSYSQQYLEDLEELAGYIREAKGLPTYWTLATEFSWRLPADTYNRTTTWYYSSDAKFTPARAVLNVSCPVLVAPSWGGWIVTFDTL